MLPAIEEVHAAAQLVERTLSETAALWWPLVCERAGAQVWIKHENHQLTGAFKVRGGLVYLDHLVRSQRDVAGVITATRGNHGQSIAYAAARHGLPCTVVVPIGNSTEKNRAMRGFGAQLVEHGRDFNEAMDHAQQLASARSLHFVSSFNEHLVRGVATYWLEFFTSVPDLDVAYVPIGLGSGMCAAIAVRDGLNLKTRLVGVVSSAAPAYARSLQAGHVVEHPSTTKIADGVAVRQPNAEALAILQRGVERIVEVTDDEVRAAMRALFVDTHNVAEGAGAAGMAAVLQERERIRAKRIGVVLTGGNVDRKVFADVLAS